MRSGVCGQVLKPPHVAEPALSLQEVMRMAKYSETLDAIVSIKDKKTQLFAEGFVSVIIHTVSPTNNVCINGVQDLLSGMQHHSS